VLNALPFLLVVILMWLLVAFGVGLAIVVGRRWVRRVVLVLPEERQAGDPQVPGVGPPAGSRTIHK
jgi:hypothetical protein